MASIQQSINQALSSLAHAKFMKQHITTSKKIVQKQEEIDKDIAAFARGEKRDNIQKIYDEHTNQMADKAKEWAKENPDKQPEEFFTPPIDITQPYSGPSANENWWEEKSSKAQERVNQRIKEKNNQKQAFKEKQKNFKGGTE